MKRASSRPQQLKEQLLQAVDAQNNIQNMMALLDVICCLERYPMTKEALVETRLGKLINDVRKRSTDEDLVKRLKNLVRRWQRLVGVNEALEKAAPSHVFKASSAPAKHVPRSTQTLSENYSETLFHNNMNQRDEIMQGSASSKTTNYPTRFRKSKIPILANKLYSSSFKHLQYTGLRRSLFSQHSQDDRNIINRDQHRSHRQVTSVKTTLHSVVKEPAQSTCITSSIRDSYYLNVQQPSDLLNLLKPAALNVSLAEVSSTVTDTNMKTFEETMRKNQYNSPTLKLDGRPAEDGSKITQLPGDKLTHDSPTQQIRSLSNESFTKDCQRSKGNEVQNSEDLKQCSFQQANWRDGLIQNTLLTSERSGMDFSAAENVKPEKNHFKECRKQHTCIADFPVTDLPGVSREITERDLVRIRSHRWHGVNGCYDNQNNWYDWTQSITLNPYRDGSTLKISPYVGIDYRL